MSGKAPLSVVEVASPKVRVRLPQVPVPPTVKVTDWPTRAEEGEAMRDVIVPGGITVIVGPVTNEGVQTGAEPSAVIVKLPTVVYVWLTVVVVFGRTVVDVASPKLTVMGVKERQLEELTVTETDCPTNMDVGNADTDSAAQAALDMASKAHTTNTNVFKRSFTAYPWYTSQPSRSRQLWVA